MIFRQLFDLESSTYTYIIGDEISKETILIDPVYELVDRDLEIISQLGLKLTLALNTHCHADHVTGSGEIKKRINTVKTAIAKASMARADLKLEDGMVLNFGKYELKCIATPGHTNGCMSFYIENSGSSGMVFTGDTLLIRGCGRTDFQEGSASSLYESVHKRLFSLPLSTLVYPGHDYKGRTCSSIEEEVKYNLRLTKTKEQFVELMNNLGLAHPKKIDIAVPANLNCGLDYNFPSKV